MVKYKRTYPTRRRVRRKVAPKRKRRFARVPRVRFGNNNIGLPAVKTVKLEFFQTVQFSTTAGVLSSYIFDMSSIYDPDVSGTGLAPMGKAKWASLYSNYEVLGSKITTKWLNNATNAIPHYVGNFIDKDAVLSSTNVSQLKELQHGRGFATLPANSNAHRSVTAYYSPRVIYGSSATNNHQFKAGMSNNPSLRTYCILVAQATDASTSSTANMTAEVRIQYTVRLSSPIEITA